MGLWLLVSEIRFTAMFLCKIYKARLHIKEVLAFSLIAFFFILFGCHQLN